MYLGKEAPTRARACVWASEGNFQHHFSLPSVQALGTRSSGLVTSALCPPSHPRSSFNHFLGKSSQQLKQKCL